MIMIYVLLCYLLSALRIVYNVVWFVCLLLNAGIPWLICALGVVYFVTRMVQLKRPSVSTSSFILKELSSIESGLPEDTSLYWPVAHRGADFDAPENSAAALKICASQRCSKVLLDLGVTKCGELVILHKSTIQKGNKENTLPINELSYASMQNFNISEHHALHEQFQPEKILTLSNLLTMLETNNLIIFLLVSSTTNSSLNTIANTIRKNPIFTTRIVICSTSINVLYKLRKECSDLVCGLWVDKHNSLMTKCLPMSTLFVSVYRTILRSVIVPLIGINVAFISEDEFNAYTKQLWMNASVQPIVYSVNSPNEKRYFQKVLCTQYVTQSLRSEPQLLLRNDF